MADIPTTDELLDLALSASDSTELPAPYCESSWHTERHEDDGFCPVCFGGWWAIDGSEPYDLGLYWLQILARRRTDARMPS